jgi:hypothetical protein
MIDPEMMCRKHLLGEHNEIHKHRHNFEKKHSIKKRIELKQIEPANMKKRHDELVKEMLRRGYNHNSPYEMPDLSHLTDEELNCKVDKFYNFVDLCNRCASCCVMILNKELF